VSFVVEIDTALDAVAVDFVNMLSVSRQRCGVAKGGALGFVNVLMASGHTPVCPS